MTDTKDRKTFLGGSDSAAVMGLSRYATPLNVYYQKVGEPDPFPQPADPMREKRLRRGKLMEPVVIEMLRAEYPIKIVNRSTDAAPIYYQHPQFQFLAAQIDFEWMVTKEMLDALPTLGDLPVGSIQNGEVKTVHPFGAGEWGTEGTDEIPIEYACQGYHGLGVTGRLATLVVLLIGSDNLVPYTVLRNEKIVNGVVERGSRFWRENVLQHVPPSAVTLADAYKLLARRKDTDIQASPIALALYNDLGKMNTVLSSTEKRIEEIKLSLGKEMLGVAVNEAKLENRHRLMFGKEVLLTVTPATRRSIGVDDVLEAAPELERLVKTSRFLTFRMPKAK